MTGTADAFLYVRSDSRRLKGKVFFEFGGAQVIDIVHARATRLDVGRVVILTTDRSVDDCVETHCAARGYDCFRGDSENLVRRTMQAIDEYSTDVLVRVNGDSPLFEPSLVNAALANMNAPVEMVSNLVERSFPYGVAVECVRAEAYARVAGEAMPSELEHVTQHLYRLPDKISIRSMRDVQGDNASLRLTLDTPEDALALARLCVGWDITTTPYWKMLDLPAPVPAFGDGS